MTALLTDHRSFSSVPTAADIQNDSKPKLLLSKDIFILVIAGTVIFALISLVGGICFFHRRGTGRRGQFEPQEMEQSLQVQEEAKSHPFIPPYASSISVSEARKAYTNSSISTETANRTPVSAQGEVAVPPWLSDGGAPQPSHPSPDRSVYSASPDLAPTPPLGAGPYQMNPSLNVPEKGGIKSEWQSQLSLAGPHVAHNTFYLTVDEDGTHSSPGKPACPHVHEDNNPYIPPRQALQVVPGPSGNNLALPTPWNELNNNRVSSIISHARYMDGRDTMYSSSSVSSEYPPEGVPALPGWQHLQRHSSNMRSTKNGDEGSANAREKKPLDEEVGGAGSAGSGQDRWEKVRRLFTGEAPRLSGG